MARIFISYRRDDTEAETGRIRDQFRRRWPWRHKIVRDVDSVRPGEDFTRWIERELSRCDHVLVVIGRRWLELLAERKRAEDSGKGLDRLRHEIIFALEDPSR